MNDRRVRIAVVGSVNLDIVARVGNFPEPGETITNAEVSRFPGGKGANQALAAHRLGAEVYMAACVGDDTAAGEALRLLREEGVNLDYCRTLPGHSTGLALITVSASGENQIVVAPGANAAFHADLLRLPDVDAVIAQLEVPMDTVLKAAGSGGHFFCLNAAPARPVPGDVLDRTDLLVVNEIEARAIGSGLEDYRGLLATTYGGDGAVLSREGREIARARSPRVDVVDTTGAGDAFTAALSLGLVSAMEPQAALERACLVGALTTTRPGASTSPRLADLEARSS
ncbi:MAG: ribokinase [Xanthomonadales bacterium]|nr:ribokinase [Xanthomonadales bacterium]NIX12698.1 ribokinase [Xanthomonadales bacterium]